MGLTCSKNGFTIRLTCDLCHGLQLSLYRVSGRWTNPVTGKSRKGQAWVCRPCLERIRHGK